MAESKWSFSHMEQLVPTKAVWRGPAATRELQSAPHSFDHLQIELADSDPQSWSETLESFDTDALAIVHRGRLVYERYFGACGPHRRHALMSTNKVDGRRAGVATYRC